MKNSDITATLTEGIPAALADAVDAWRRPQGFDMLVSKWSLLAESSNRERMRLHTVQVHQGDKLVGAAFVHVIHKLAVGDYTGGTLERLTRWGRRVGITLLGYDVAYLEIPFCNRSGVLFAPEVDDATQDAVWHVVLRALVPLRCDALCIKTDVRDLSAGRVLEGSRLVRLPFLEQNVLTFEGDRPTDSSWLSQLERHQRANVRRQRRLFAEAGGTIDTVADPTALATLLGSLGENTNAKAQAEGGLPLPLRTGAEFYAHWNELLGERGRVWVARLHGQVVGFMAGLQSFDSLYVKFVGLDYDAIGDSFAYFNLFYSAISSAAQAGLRYVDLGTTLSDVKRRLGARQLPSQYHIDFRHFSLRPLAPLLRRRFSGQA